MTSFKSGLDGFVRCVQVTQEGCWAKRWHCQFIPHSVHVTRAGCVRRGGGRERRRDGNWIRVFFNWMLAMSPLDAHHCHTTLDSLNFCERKNWRVHSFVIRTHHLIEIDIQQPWLRLRTFGASLVRLMTNWSFHRLWRFHNSIIHFFTRRMTGPTRRL